MIWPQGRYEKIYNDAADEWRRDATLEQSNKVFETLKSKLGKPGNRVLHSASEAKQLERPTGRSFIRPDVRNRFERGEGMETFTIVERERPLAAGQILCEFNGTEIGLEVQSFECRVIRNLRLEAT